jgi:hypothetical protein
MVVGIMAWMREPGFTPYLVSRYLRGQYGIEVKRKWRERLYHYKREGKTYLEGLELATLEYAPELKGVRFVHGMRAYWAVSKAMGKPKGIPDPVVPRENVFHVDGKPVMKTFEVVPENPEVIREGWGGDLGSQKKRTDVDEARVNREAVEWVAAHFWDGDVARKTAPSAKAFALHRHATQNAMTQKAFWDEWTRQSLKVKEEKGSENLDGDDIGLEELERRVVEGFRSSGGGTAVSGCAEGVGGEP